MITFKELTIRNFLSYGNNTTTLKLDFTNPTLIVGKNYDSVVNGQVDSNGSGKSAILNAISYCLFDKTISNIDKSDVVNYINQKNMEVSLSFIKDKTCYKVERYRKNKAKGGDGVRLLIGTDFTDMVDKTPDSVSNTNKHIESILGIPFDIFSRIVVFTASYEPFLSLPSSHDSKANQRDIIEELFGLTELSRKSEVLKDIIKTTKH
jgi:DNA repair exonuclease SbcCD ATPase subunit